MDETQAPTVRLIRKLFIDGHSISNISQELTRRELKTVKGKTTWLTSSIRSILSNEKYKGDLLLQNSYTTDFLTKQVAKTPARFPSTTSRATMNRSSIPTSSTKFNTN